MRYVFDACLSYRLARMLAAIKVEAIPLRDILPEWADDLEIYATLRASHDVLLTYDHKQKTRIHEAKAIKASGVTALWIGPFWGKLELWPQAQWIINRWPQIDGFASNVAFGTCATIKQNGRAEPFTLLT